MDARNSQSPPRRRAAPLVALICCLGLLVAPFLAAGASAQTVDDDVLDALRAEVPEGNPGKYDVTEADAEFGRLVAILGQSTAVSDFGDGSVLTGVCGGYAYSFDRDGNLLDAAVAFGNGSPPLDAIDGGQAFTASNRFRVDPRGVVQYFGFSPRDGDGPENHTWEIKTSGISLDKGGDPNTGLKNRNAGLVDLDQDLPVKFTANIKIEGKMMSENQPDCIGKGHIAIEGDGLTDPVGLAGLALLGGGLLGLLFNARPARTFRGGS